MFDVFAARLPLSFDPEKLRADLAQVPPEAWINHYRSDEYEGDWAIAALRSVAGHPQVIHAVPGARQDHFFKNTPLLERCPYFREVLARFECRIGAARLMRLGPGAKILEHTDDMGDDDSGELRIHIPVQTHPDVLFWVNRQRVPMLPGETWYADFNQPHAVENNSPIDRVHLVLDCEPNEWLLAQIRKGAEISRITAFLDQIDISSTIEPLPDTTFLPGLDIRGGAIVIDLEKLQHPGDILHEAGHIAVTSAEKRPLLDGNIGENDPNAMGNEIATILWSYAALRAIGLPGETVFHPHGYKGQSDWHLENFKSGRYIGLPLLEWMGLCAGPDKAGRMGVEAFPAMVRWMRE